MDGILLAGIVFMVAVAAVVALAIFNNRAARSASPPDGVFRPSPDSYTAISISASLRLDYEDRDGEFTTRDVYAYRYDWDGNGYLIGRCSLRKAERTFRTGRIRQV